MLTIERPFLNQILNHLQDCYPEEGCGLVAGDALGRVTAVYPIENSLHSPTRYQMNPQQQIEAMLDLENKGWQLVAIYHSHPHSQAFPSETDIHLAFYPEAFTMIVSLADRKTPSVRLFQIEEQTVTEIKLTVGNYSRGPVTLFLHVFVQIEGVCTPYTT
ncbi:MAG: peptidase [Ardenticatenaceae bacterium]|nr:MAG: peptidase [Ardenticatenaceae bacterium]